MLSPETIDAITSGYLQCAAWADAPEGSRARFTHQAKRTAHAVVRAFVEFVGPLAPAALECEGYSPERFGHDLWLTRGGHGAGFWDRDELNAPAPEVGPLPDRDNFKRAVPKGSTIGEALTLAANGRGWVSPFYGPDLLAYRGWLFIDGSAEHVMRGHPSPWGYWRAWQASGANV